MGANTFHDDLHRFGVMFVAIMSGLIDKVYANGCYATNLCGGVHESTEYLFLFMSEL
ncbi:iron-sulfur cluster binding protein [Alicyclobacillus hesperidum URH17-3-68]|nr:iron-sulfur cluster binding protein [Alicyclobacillus hesperidum URH17-3-68]